MRSANSFFLIFILFFLFFLVSCQKTVEPIVYIESVDTIKYEITRKAESLDWTTEIAPDALIPENTDNLSSDKYFYSSLNLPSNFAQNKKSVYPTLKNFYSLDLSILSSSQIERLEQIASSIQNKQIDESFYNSNFKYLHIVDNYLIQDFPKWDSFVFGKPFEIQSEPKILQIPIRFLTQHQYLDAFFIVENKTDNFYLNQLIFGEIVND